MIVAGLAVVAVVSAFLALVYIPSRPFRPYSYDPVEPARWPTRDWPTSTPEEQGVSSARLVEMVKYIRDRSAKDRLFRIDSVTIVRNGHLVADIYPNPLYPPGSPHVLHSCTKSIVGTLVGIAIDQGFLRSVDVPVYEIFRARGYSVSDERMKGVTVHHLLAMSTGVRTQDDVEYGYRGLFAVQASDDWIGWFLSRPMDEPPGTYFDYSNTATFMLAAIVREATGMDTLAFANRYLFEPLGIREVEWDRNPHGYAVAWARMWLTPHDMAKLGLLWLQKGRWEDRQIVSAEWMERSRTPHSFPKNYHDVLDENGRKDNRASGATWVARKFLKPFHDGYGYQVWLDRSGTFAAMGSSGQFIIVDPSRDLVAVFTSKLTGLDTFAPAKIFRSFILDAVKGGGPIPADRATYARLVAASSAPETTAEPEPVPPLPAVALRVSGITYRMEPNDWRYDDFRVEFDPSWDHARFSYTARGGRQSIEFAVGLDGVPRSSQSDGHTYVAKGGWTDDSSFSIEYEVIGYSTQDRWNLRFTDDRIMVEEVNELTGTKVSTGCVAMPPETQA